ncbi:MAG: acetyltransferase [Halothece sp.]
MLLKERKTGDLLKVTEFDEVYNPSHETVTAKRQAGQNEQPSSEFQKENLIFPSGEDLPRCWKDPNYRSESSPE